jgi:hypothetical protein
LAEEIFGAIGGAIVGSDVVGVLGDERGELGSGRGLLQDPEIAQEDASELRCCVVAPWFADVVENLVGVAEVGDRSTGNGGGV